MEEMTEDDWEAWYETNEAMEEDIAERCRQWVRTALKDCGETIENRLYEAEDEGLVTDQASALKFRKAMVERLKERAERKFYRALERGEIRL